MAGLFKIRLEDRVTVEERSFLALADVAGAPFDSIFSDLGGLNCAPDLSPIIQQLQNVLRPGGVVTWVLMPRLCLWEVAEALRGNFRVAFRRFSSKGVRSHLEGFNFDVYYFSPQQVIQWFGESFEELSLEGLSVITPTAESKNFAKMFPRVYRALSWLDDLLSPHSPWNGWGDFFILSLRYAQK